MRAKTTVLVPERQLCSWLSTGPLSSPTVIHTNKIWPQPFYGYHGICQSRPVGALCALTYYCYDLIIVDCVKYIILDFYILNFLTIKENFSFFTNNHQCETGTKGFRGMYETAKFPILRDKSRFFTFSATDREISHSPRQIAIFSVLREKSRIFL